MSSVEYLEVCVFTDTGQTISQDLRQVNLQTPRAAAVGQSTKVRSCASPIFCTPSGRVPENCHQCRLPTMLLSVWTDRSALYTYQGYMEIVRQRSASCLGLVAITQVKVRRSHFCDPVCLAMKSVSAYKLTKASSYPPLGNLFQPSVILHQLTLRQPISTFSYLTSTLHPEPFQPFNLISECPSNLGPQNQPFKSLL